MGLSSLADAPLLTKSAGKSLPPLGKPSRQDDRSIDSLFEDGVLVGIDEESPLEIPLPKQAVNTTADNENEVPTKQLETSSDEFTSGKWKETTAKWGKRSPLDSMDRTSNKTKDDEWGESTDILQMLPDGSELDIKTKSERGEKKFTPHNIPNNWKVSNERSSEAGFEFGEYQPSCLSSTGRRTPVAGRRRSSPTSFTNTDDALPVVAGRRRSSPTSDDVKDEVLPPKNLDNQQNQQRPRVRPSTPQDSSRLEGYKTATEAAGKDNTENSLFERLRQTLVSKGVIENEKNQLTNEVKHLKEENCSLKEEVLKVEKEKLHIEKEMSEMEITSSSAICKQFSEEKEAAQRNLVQLSSEVHLLKNTCILADEKLSSLQRVYQEEVDMLKDSHARELEAKQEQLNSERAFLANQKQSVETLTHLVTESNEWCKKVEEIQRSMVTERETANKFRSEFLDGLEKSVNQQHSSITAMQNQLEEVVRMLSLAVLNIKDLQTSEKENIQKERSNLQALQEAVQCERAQSLADLTVTRQKLEDIRTVCLQEKETFLQKCFEEKKDIAAEREAVLKMKEQLYHADAALEKQLLEHTARMQNETGELTKQRTELERARVMAAEIAQEVEEGRRDLELRCRAFERNNMTPPSLEEDPIQYHRRSKPYRRQHKRASSSGLIPWRQFGKKVKTRRCLSEEGMMANTEALLHLQEQRDFLQQARKNLHANKQWSKSFLRG